MADKGPRFRGDGWDRSDFSEEERAQIRERNRHYDNNFVDVSWIWPLKPLAAVIGNWKAFTIIMSALMAFGGAVAWAVERGLLTGVGQ